MALNKFSLKLDGQPYEIERRGEIIVVNGMEFPLTVKDGNFLVGGNPHTVKLQDGTAVVDGISYPAEAVGLAEPKDAGSGGRRKASNTQAADAAGALLAVMPGLIIKILKKEGDEVAAGETVLILEAMKMQNEIQAKVAGKITSVAVKEGENVEIRQVLCVIE